MNIQEKIDISILNSVYGNLLTPHKQEIVRLYYDCDISLFEISEQLNISRQAVRDSLVRAEKQLVGFEEKLGIVKKNEMLVKMLNEIDSLSDIDKIKEIVHKTIDKVEE